MAQKRLLNDYAFRLTAEVEVGGDDEQIWKYDSDADHEDEARLHESLQRGLLHAAPPARRIPPPTLRCLDPPFTSFCTSLRPSHFPPLLSLRYTTSRKSLAPSPSPFPRILFFLFLCFGLFPPPTPLHPALIYPRRPKPLRDVFRAHRLPVIIQTLSRCQNCSPSLRSRHPHCRFLSPVQDRSSPAVSIKDFHRSGFTWLQKSLFFSLFFGTSSQVLLFLL